MFKFKLYQKVYYLKDDQVHSAKILSRKYVDNWTDECYTAQQYDVFNRFGPTSIRYATIHGDFEEDVLFSTREKLTQSL